MVKYKNAVNVYVSLIKKGKKTIDDVAEEYKDDVQALLEEEG